MSDKIIRDELLRSHRFQRLSGDTPKLLFLVLLLSSDHHSNAEFNTTVISQSMGRDIGEEAAATLLTELHERDLVRPYQVDGKAYVHIPRSRQRIRYVHGKHPRPPEQVEDKKINALIAKVGLESAGSEEKRSEAVLKTKEHLTLKPVHKSPAKWWETTETIKQKAYSLGLKDNPGESRDSLYLRVRAKLDEMKARP